MNWNQKKANELIGRTVKAKTDIHCENSQKLALPEQPKSTEIIDKLTGYYGDAIKETSIKPICGYPRTLPKQQRFTVNLGGHGLHLYLTAAPQRGSKGRPVIELAVNIWPLFDRDPLTGADVIKPNTRAEEWKACQDFANLFGVEVTSIGIDTHKFRPKQDAA